jgi:toxin-antitoxin system PIN domain toxin
LIALPDVNVLLALVWSNHLHHDAAHDWFSQEAAAGWATCLLTQSAFMRLSLNPQVVGVSIDSKAAHNLLQSLIIHPEHRYYESAPALMGMPFDELLPRIVGYRQVSDATLLHVVRIHGLKLVTFDLAVAAICPWAENLQLLPAVTP